jgi:hypothetical protein
VAVAAAALALIGFALKSTSSSDTGARAPSPAKTVVQTAKDSDARKPAEPETKQAGATAQTQERELGDGEKKADGEDKAEDGEQTADDGEETLPGGKVLVYLATSPEDAEIYDTGQRIGEGQVSVKVDPKDKKVLLLVREGYWPRKVILDGTQKYVTVGMREKPEETKQAPTKPRAVSKKPAPGK